MLRLAGEVIRCLEGGERPPDAALLRLLRSGGCPPRVLTLLEGCRWVRGAHRVLVAILRHPACSTKFAVEVVDRVGWVELLGVAREPRAAPAVRNLAERRLLERVREMSEGERVTLARRAPRLLFSILIEDDAPRTIAALLDNPLFCEADALRLVNLQPKLECIRVVLRHPRWGRHPTVVQQAVRRKNLPLALAASIAVTLSEQQCRQLEVAPETPVALRRVLSQLRAYRAGEAAGRR